MNKPHILFLYSSSGYGGIVRNLSLIINRINTDKFKISVCFIGQPEDQKAKLQIDPQTAVQWHEIPANKRYDKNCLSQLSKLIAQKDIDILSCHGAKSDFYGSLLSTFYKSNCKLITIAHGWVTPGLKMRAYYLIDKLSLHFFDKVILVNSAQRKQLIGYFLSEKKLTLVLNAIDSNEIKTAANNPTAALENSNVSDEDILIGFFGRLSKEKNIKTLLHALKTILKHQTNIKLLICGEGPQREELEEFAKQLEIHSNVIFTGHIKEIAPLYKRLSVYVSASLREGLPNNILEAQALGIPCVTSKIAGHKQIIIPEKSGILTEPNDSLAIACSVMRLLRDTETAKRFASNAEQIVTEKFCLNNRVEQLEKIYSETHLQ